MMDNSENQRSSRNDFNRSGGASGFAAYSSIYTATTGLSGAIFSSGMYANSAMADQFWLAMASLCALSVAGSVYKIHQDHCAESQKSSEPLAVRK
ncbi:MAG: hypothetical protein CO093_00640 [Alphaproteobacteria bacterium CG_4_9_14_3_um_filter_47_13]|nr:MAG: hypothetical protein CO093_00640 [Alphaproteobacteria bacterium CG_4_9_14_3_um_filter_47_13]